MQIRLHLTALHLAYAVILLADVAVVAVWGAAGALARARVTFEYVFEHVACFRLEGVVVKGAVGGGAVALQVEVVAGLLLAEARVVHDPFLCSGWADEGVEALPVFVEGDVAGHCFDG